MVRFVVLDMLAFIGRSAADTEIHLALRGRAAKVFELIVQRHSSGPRYFFFAVGARYQTQYSLDQLSTAMELVGVSREQLMDELRRVIVEQALLHDAKYHEALRVLDVEGQQRLTEWGLLHDPLPKIQDWLTEPMSARQS